MKDYYFWAVRTLLVAAFVLPSVVNAESGFGVYVDQDFFVPAKNEDRDYTMGFAIELFTRDEPRLIGPLANQVGRLVGFEEADKTISRSLLFGSVNYTPDDIANPAPIADDRPYSSLLYLSGKRVKASEEAAVGVEVLVGVLGTNFAQEVQTAIHSFLRDNDITDADDPKGWRNQISDGGELTARVRLTWSKLLARKTLSSLTFDSAWNTGLAIGYDTSAHAGISARFGQLNSKIWTLPYDPINRGNLVPSTSKNEWYFWAAYNARMVGYNALLQGQFRDSDVTYDSDGIERLIHEGGVGVTVGWQQITLTMSVNTKTSELKSGLGDHSQYWGGTTLSWRF